jgi:hypothetical protein
MQRKDWLALVAVHSDSWLLSVAFFYGVKLDQAGRCAGSLQHSLRSPLQQLCPSQGLTACS